MQSRLNPYINFKDNARQAMEFYQSIFGGKLDINTYKEFQAVADPGDGDKIMHAQLEAANGIVFMASDTPKGMPFHEGTSMSMSLSGDNMTELKDYWDKLSVGATITMPFAPAPWGDTFGMLVDQFGVAWMVNVIGKKA